MNFDPQSAPHHPGIMGSITSLLAVAVSILPNVEQWLRITSLAFGTLAAIVMRLDTDTLDDQDFLFSGTETSAPRIAVRRTTLDSFQIFTDAGSVVTANGSVTEGNNYLALFYFNSTSSAIRINGSFVNSGSIANNSFTSLNIGGNFSEDQALNGFIAEMIAFTGTANQEIMEGYLAWKWGLQGNLPAGHPYKNSRP